MLAAVVLTAPLAAPLSAQCGPSNGRVELTPVVTVGRAGLHWSVGPSAGAVKSELDFHGVSSRGARLAGRVVVLRGLGGVWLLSGSATQGVLNEGRLQDVDFDVLYGTTVRRSVAGLTGRTGSWTGAMGRCWTLPSLPGTAAFTLWVGWTRQRQDFRIQNGTQLVPDSMPLPGLDSRYAATWDGPWMAGEAVVGLARSTLAVRFTGCALNHYHAEGTWNLRWDLAQPRSYAQWAVGWGWSVDLHYRYRLVHRLALMAGLEHTLMQAKNGDDIVYAANGDLYGSSLIRTTTDRTMVSFGLGASF